MGDEALDMLAGPPPARRKTTKTARRTARAPARRAPRKKTSARRTHDDKVVDLLAGPSTPKKSSSPKQSRSRDRVDVLTGDADEFEDDDGGDEFEDDFDADDGGEDDALDVLAPTKRSSSRDDDAVDILAGERRPRSREDRAVDLLAGDDSDGFEEDGDDRDEDDRSRRRDDDRRALDILGGGPDVDLELYFEDGLRAPARSTSPTGRRAGEDDSMDAVEQLHSSLRDTGGFDSFIRRQKLRRKKEARRKKKVRMSLDKIHSLSKPKRRPPSMSVDDPASLTWLRRNVPCSCPPERKPDCTLRKPHRRCDRAKWAFSKLEEAKESRFKPRVNARSRQLVSAKGEDADGRFLARMDTSSKQQRREREFKSGEADYKARVDKKTCRQCGAKQSYEEVLEKRDRCPTCGLKYRPRTAWGDVSSGFFRRMESDAARRQRRKEKAEKTTAAMTRTRTVFDPKRKKLRTVTVKPPAWRAVRHGFLERMEDASRRHKEVRGGYEKRHGKVVFVEGHAAADRKRRAGLADDDEDDYGFADDDLDAEDDWY
eukprot:PLAT15631.1.p1 GENE.PLAT15631.1~~PLAT15631.1.p1  ORF type:complete len:542 (+),score=193.62 PLAT15631.1:48-1673(+)